MSRQRAIVLGLLLASSLVLSGCKKKKPPVPPPQAQAPTITDTTGVPAAIPEVSVPQPEPKPEAPAPPVAKKPKKKIRAPKVDAKKATPPAAQQAAATNPASEVVADKAPSKVVVEAGGKSDPTPPPLVADTANEQAARQRLNTAQLINTAETNIRNIGRQLSADEEAMVQHIRGYIEQSRQASKDGDTERAYNLAVKAQLLSDSLKK